MSEPPQDVAVFIFDSTKIFCRQLFTNIEKIFCEILNLKNKITIASLILTLIANS